MPSVLFVRPARGPLEGGTNITLTGKHFPRQNRQQMNNRGGTWEHTFKGFDEAFLIIVYVSLSCGEIAQT
jgi:hypothetical protein